MTSIDNLLERIAKIANKPCPKNYWDGEYDDGYSDGWSSLQEYLDEILYLFTVESEEEKNV